MSELKYKVVNTAAKGKSCFAVKNIKESEVVLEETPLVSCQFSWNRAYGYSACDYCFFPLETAEQNIRRLTFNNAITLLYPEADRTQEVLQNIVECSECQTKFCSSNCLDEAEKKYHKVLCLGNPANCGFEQINEAWKKMHYPPETCSVMLVLRILAMIKTNPDLLSVFSEFCDRSVNDDEVIIHKMLGEKFVSQLRELHQMVASVFCEDLVLSKYLEFEGFVSLFALIGTNSQGIGTSSFAAWVSAVSDLDLENDAQKTELDEFIDFAYNTLDETAGQFLNNEGSGLYSNQSKINHSCKPNAEIRFEHSNNILQVVALRPISSEEEISISYLDECEINRSRHSRQKYLQENYLFLCECEKCLDEIEQDDVTSDDEDCSDEDDDDDVEMDD